jgi:hypothetical protein
MEWLKRNGPMALGVGLPALLVVFFVLAAWLPKFFIEPPKYDALFLVNYYENGTNTLQYQVLNKHLRFTFIGENYGSWPKFYRFSPSTGAMREITIPIPEVLPQVTQDYNNQPKVKRITPVPVSDTDELTIDNSTVAPDGYSFRSDSYGRSGGLMGEFFFSPRYRYQAALVKNGNSVQIPSMEPNDYYYNARFIGWVIP